MAMIDAILSEMDQEAGATRKLLERVPEDKLAWKPHAKSFSLGQLALHIAQLPGAISQLVMQNEVEVPRFTQNQAASRAEILEAFERGLATARATLGAVDDAGLMAPWTLRRGEQVVMSVPRVGLLRSILLNHHYHHRGQLSVYLRILGVPVPSIYGPSADENPFAEPAAAGAARQSV